MKVFHGVALILYISSCLFLGGEFVFAQQGSEPFRKMQGETNPYEVTLYEDENYVKPIGVWNLAPGMRMKGIASIDASPGSISLGSKVAVILFPNKNFTSIHQKMSSYTDMGDAKVNPEFYLIPSVRFKDSIPSINKAFLSGGGCSLVIHRKDVDDFLGVYLQSGPKLGFNAKSGQFYALPENASADSVRYDKITMEGPFSLTLIPGGFGSMSLYPSKSPPGPDDIEVHVTTPSGVDVRFPEQQGDSPVYELADYGIHDMISSITIKYKGPFKESAYSDPDPVRVRAPAAGESPNRTVAPAQMMDGFVIADEPKPQSGGPTRVEGFWISNAGDKYDFSQTGEAFAWTAPSLGQQGAGLLDGNAISSTWTGNNPGSAKGQITQIDASNLALEIVWNNGVTFARQLEPTASKKTNISGKWKGAMGLSYEVSQSGNEFTWLVAAIGEKASGTLNGALINVQWKGPVSNGSAEGKIVSMDASGKAMRIEWNNGVTFERE